MAMRSPHANRPGSAFRRGDQRRFLIGARRGLLGQRGSKGAFSLAQLASNGAWGGFPQQCTNGSYTYAGFVKNDGTQWIVEIDSAGQVVDTLQVGTSGSQDDHNYPVVQRTPGGGLLTCYGEHNATAVVRFRYSATGRLSGFGSEYTVATGTSQFTTYSQLYFHAGSNKWVCLYRATQLKWAIMESADAEPSSSGEWTVVGAIVSDTDQMYCTAGWVSADKLRCIANYNPTFGNGSLRCFELDFVTGAVTSGAGTLSNVRTGSPTTTATLSACTEVYTPVAGYSAGVFQPDPPSPAASAFVFVVLANDQQTHEYWFGKVTGADAFDPGDWTFTKICDGLYGVGDTETPPYRTYGRVTLSYNETLDEPRAFLSRMVRGRWHLETFDAVDADGTAWKPSMHWDSLDLGLSDAIMTPQAIDNPNSAIPFTYTKGTHHNYQSFSRAVYAPVIVRPGNSAPRITSAASFPAVERKALEITLTADQPAGWRISGGADAALFFLAGDRLYLGAKEYLSPADANADNVYEVQVEAISLSGRVAATDIRVPISQAVYAPSQLLSWSQKFSDVSWVKTGVTISQDTADILDPLGTNLGCKLTQQTTTNVHRVQKPATLTGATQYTLSCFFHEGSVDFCALNIFDGTTSFGMTFDAQRGLVVAPKDSGGAIQGHGVLPKANSWFRMFITATVGASPSSSIVQLIIKRFAGSNQSEVGVTSANAYIFGAMLNTGALGDYAARTT